MSRHSRSRWVGKDQVRTFGKLRSVRTWECLYHMWNWITNQTCGYSHSLNTNRDRFLLSPMREDSIERHRDRRGDKARWGAFSQASTSVTIDGHLGPLPSIKHHLHQPLAHYILIFSILCTLDSNNSHQGKSIHLAREAMLISVEGLDTLGRDRNMLKQVSDVDGERIRSGRIEFLRNWWWWL